MTLPIGYTIRTATIGDAGSITSAHVQAWKKSYQNIIDQDYLDNIRYEKRLAWRKKIIEEKFGQQLVVTYRGEVVGFCDSNAIEPDNQAKAEDKSQISKEKGQIYGLYLLKEHQGKGIGKQLLKQSLEWLRKKELSPIILWTLKDNQKARDFYESQGGTLAGEIQIKIGNKFYPEVGYRFA